MKKVRVRNVLIICVIFLKSSNYGSILHESFFKCVRFKTPFNIDLYDFYYIYLNFFVSNTFEMFFYCLEHLNSL